MKSWCEFSTPNRNPKLWLCMACWSPLESIPISLRWPPSKTFFPELAAQLFWCAKRMPPGRGASSRNIAGFRVMKPRKLISVEFRSRKRRDDSFAVQVKRDRALEIGAVGQHMGFTQPGQNFPSRMSISIALSHRNHSESGMHPLEQQWNGGSCAAMVRHFQQIRFGLLVRDLAF